VAVADRRIIADRRVTKAPFFLGARVPFRLSRPSFSTPDFQDCNAPCLQAR
jgi:hypothetical protein